MPKGSRKPSAKEIILTYLREHLGEPVSNQTLRQVSGQNDVPRTIRLLRQEGWDIEYPEGLRGFVILKSLEKKKTGTVRAAVSRRVRYEVLHRDGFRCQACGRSAKEGAVLQIDHIVPVEWSGTNELSNLQTLCEECNAGKQAWVKGQPADVLRDVISLPTVEQRIEALFDKFPNQDIPSSMIQLVSKGALDWQRALRRIRQRTGKNIKPNKDRRGYRYFVE